MKQLLLFFLSILYIISLASCSDNEEKKSDPAPLTPTLEGKWYTTSIETSRAGLYGNIISTKKQILIRIIDSLLANLFW